MSCHLLIRALVCGLFLLVLAPFTALAQHGHELAADTCVLHIGPYKMYFASYQPDTYYDRKFCQELPGTGNSVLVLDFVEQELRSIPVEVRVIQDTGSENNLEAVTVTHFPAKVYPTGSIDVKYNFDKPGKFVGLVSIGDKQEHVSRFPFSVGETGAISHLTHYIMVIVPVLVGIAVVVFFSFRDRRKPSEITVSS
ncbi:hypothetical protein [Nitrospira sp. BLG_2]|uniref:hypothetical protein n=1 Tax=Nitrospira sp. BLG_2 TaxID=3397507 RepID=UPI003B9B4CF0